jgi:DNA-binding PucR family transcriptional regulator
MQIDASARTLALHPNTLRHRLRRFEEVTGSNLRRPTDIIELWWALEWASLTGAGPLPAIQAAARANAGP